MERVDIYIESDSVSQRSAVRMAGYVMECVTGQDKVHTTAEFISTIGTYHAVILQALVRAMARMRRNCEIHIHTRDFWVLGRIKDSLAIWADAGFTTRQGKPLSNQREWEDLHRMVRNHLIVEEHGTHGYYNWMMAEMARGDWEYGVWTPRDYR